MTHQYPAFTAPTSHLQPPAPKKKQWFKNPLLLVPVAALLLGLSIGSSSAKTETVEVVKEVEVTKEVKVPGPERVVTKEVKVPTTPASCLEALTLNEEAFDLASESLGYVAKGDYPSANATTAKLKAMASKVNAAKAACRNS
jgi:hypothetical protein